MLKRSSMHTGEKILLAVFLCAVLAISLLYAYRVNGRTIAQSTFSDQSGEVRVKEIGLHPQSLQGLLGVDSKLYRLEYRRDPDGQLRSAVSYQEDSYEVQQVEISWQSSSDAIVSLDDSIFYELEGGIWKRTSKAMIEDKRSHLVD